MFTIKLHTLCAGAVLIALLIAGIQWHYALIIAASTWFIVGTILYIRSMIKAGIVDKIKAEIDRLDNDDSKD